MDYSDRYEELHKHSTRGHVLLKNRILDTVCIRKELQFYDKDVFNYLKEHHDPHIPEIYDCWEEDGTFYVIESYIRGRTLEEYLAQEGPDREEKLRIIGEVLDGIEFLHNAPVPIIHRDIKADNIIIDKAGNVRIIDYDAAKTYKAGGQKDTILIGTVGSAAPEQYGFAQSDTRTDIYALGVLIRSVFATDHSMDMVVTKATRMDPDQRFQTVDELRRALSGAEVKDRKKIVPFIILASAAAVAVLVGWFLLGTFTESDDDGVEILSIHVSASRSDNRNAPYQTPESSADQSGEPSNGSDTTAFAAAATVIPVSSGSVRSSSGNVSSATYRAPATTTANSQSTFETIMSTTTAYAPGTASTVTAVPRTANPVELTEESMISYARSTNELNGSRFSREELISNLLSPTRPSRDEWEKVVDSMNINWDKQAGNANHYFYTKLGCPDPNDVISKLKSAKFTSSQITRSFDYNSDIYEAEARSKIGWMLMNVLYSRKSDYSEALKDLGYPDKFVKDAVKYADADFKSLIREGKIINDVDQ